MADDAKDDAKKAKNNYKDTLNLPKTSFDMKAGLLAKEPAIQKQWQEHDLYGQIRRQRAGEQRFVLHDGPPYANGNIHTGHAVNKVLKDMIVRIKTMEGMDSPYIPGWDCHGLPIEQKVMESLGAKAAGCTAMQIRNICRKYAEKFVALQSDQFQKLGIMGQFDKPYITMSSDYEAATLEVFAKLCEQGIVYKQLKPVHWSIENKTALAEAELEYFDRQDSSVYVLFKLADQAAAIIPHVDGDAICLAVWTTTPWTLPANMAVAVHQDYTYAAVHADTAAGGITFVIAQDRLESVMGSVQASRPDWLKGYKTLGTLTGRQIADANLKYNHPVSPGRACPIVCAPYVTLEDGTGLVHTAPGHGVEDYGTGLKHKLDIYCPVQADGTFDDTVPDWLIGMKVWDANPKIVEYLGAQGTLMLEAKITHSYPHDWRSRTPVIFRATEQWFIAVDRKPTGAKHSLRETSMDLCRKDASAGGIDFHPAWGRNRLMGMLESRPDWCISRQRVWGLPIPAFYNPEGRPLLTPASVRAVAKVFAAQGSDAWFQLTPAQLLEGYDPHKDPMVAEPAKFMPDQLTTGRDIFDVWFEAGSSWFAVGITQGLVKDIPLDVYLEGSDQHRGWFQLSLLPAVGATGKSPFKALITHGWVMDEQGHKMSKSLGNTVDVIEQLKLRGADILRLWVASTYYPDDIRCSENLIAQADDAYRKIRNTLRFCMGACSDFDAAHHSCQPASHSLDLWMKMELHVLIRDVREAYDTYEFHKASRALYEFCTVKASSVYFSAVKDRLYCEAPNSPRRRATQTVIHEVLITLVKLLAPIMPHTCQEAWEHIPFRDAAEASNVHLAHLSDYDHQVLQMAQDMMPSQPDLAMFAADEIQPGPAWIWQLLMALRDDGLIKLEAVRNAGLKNPLDAEAVFKVPADKPAAGKLLQAYIGELEDMLGVGFARVEIVPAEWLHLKAPLQIAEVEILDTREKYQRCARSWKRRPDVGSDQAYPDLSARDAAAMRLMKG
jgi:isoleucyl-tRNA synthetase